MSAAVHEKGQRLAAEGRVAEIVDSTYTVRGDTGTYVVIIAPSYSSCTCPSHGTCSHIVAAVTAAGETAAT